MEILIRSFGWENLSKMGRFCGLTGRLGEMKRNGRSSLRTGRVSRTVLDSELKLYLLISILNIIGRDGNFEKLNKLKWDIKSFFISAWPTTDVSKSSLLQKNVGKNFPVSVDCSLPSHKKMIGMKVVMLTSFHGRLQPADLGWFSPD